VASDRVVVDKADQYIEVVFRCKEMALDQASVFWWSGKEMS
jgi:hypothetical protein